MNIDPMVVDWYLGYDKEILIKYTEFCTAGPDNMHPDNTCAQQMHQKIIDVLNRHKSMHTGAASKYSGRPKYSGIWSICVPEISRFASHL